MRIAAISAALCLAFPLVAQEGSLKFDNILNARNCEVVLHQVTNTCRTILHAKCDGEKRAAIMFAPDGSREFTRVMEEYVNQTAFHDHRGGLIFIRRPQEDQRVDLAALNRGEKERFHFVSDDTSGLGVTITMSGTVERLDQSRLMSGKQVSYLFWDWTYEVKHGQTESSFEIETTTEFLDKDGLWLGNYVESTDASGRVDVNDELTSKLIEPDEAGFGVLGSDCAPRPSS